MDVTEYERSTMPARVCHWCGDDLPDDAGPGRLYCSRGHARKQTRVRQRRAGYPVVRCPHPEKRTFGYRGVAIEYARRVAAEAYECRCGAWHLASRKVSATA